MTADGPEYIETSAPLGMSLIVIGLTSIIAHTVFEIFAGWVPALIIGSLWLVLGTLLLFPDVRLYQFEQSPVEQAILHAD